MLSIHPFPLGLSLRYFGNDKDTPVAVKES